MKFYIPKLFVKNNFSVGIRKNVNEIIYFMALSVYLIITTLNLSVAVTFFENILGRLFGCIILLLLLKEIGKLRHSSTKIIWGLLFLLALLPLIFNRKMEIVTMLFFVWSSRNVEFKKIIKWTFLITLSLCFSIVILSQWGIINDYTFQNPRGIRHCLGFRYPLVPAAYLLSITMMWGWLRKFKFSIIEWLVVLLANIGMYFLTYSRLSFVSSVLFLFSLLVIEKWYKVIEKRRVIRRILIGVYIYVCTISLILTVYYNTNSDIFVHLNQILANRLELGKEGIDTYGISFWGQAIETVGNGLNADGTPAAVGTYFFIDSLYQQMLQFRGILFFLVIMILLTMTLWSVNISRDYHLFLIHIIYALNFAVQDYFLFIHFNIFLVSVGCFLIRKIKLKIQ